MSRVKPDDLAVALGGTEGADEGETVCCGKLLQFLHLARGIIRCGGEVERQTGKGGVEW